MSYKRWITVSAFLFGASFAMGWATPAGIPDLLSEDIAALEDLSGIMIPFKANTAVLLFIKNCSALLISFVLSPILCLVPVLALVFIGWLLAFVSAMVVQEKSVSYLLAGLLPHGVFELPALILGQAAALSFGMTAMLTLFKKDKNLLLSSFNRNARYLLVALILLLPAAIIETYITPILLGMT